MFRCVVVNREQTLMLEEQRYSGATHAYSQSFECLEHTVAYIDKSYNYVHLK